jgi:hypothetical protein
MREDNVNIIIVTLDLVNIIPASSLLELALITDGKYG